MNSDKPDLLDWLALRSDFDFTKARWLGGLISAFVFLGLFAMLITAVIEFWQASWSDDPKAEALRNAGLVLAAMIGVPFLVWRSVVAQKQVDVAEQGQITDRINKAVEGLGAEKVISYRGRFINWKSNDNQKEFRDGFMQRWGEGPDIKHRLPHWFDGMSEDEMDQHLTFGEWTDVTETVPNLEVRIGAIYALERIAQDSDRDHVQIMEILCAYIRQNAPKDQAVGYPLEWATPAGQNPLSAHDLKELKIWKPKAPRSDIYAAIEVIARRSARQISLEGFEDETGFWHGYRLDLRNTCLQLLELTSPSMDNVLLDGAQLQGATISEAQMRGASFRNTGLQSASLRYARLQNANFRKAELQTADLSWSKMQGCFFYKARLQNTNATVAKLNRAFLICAEMQRARIYSADLRLAQCGGADLSGADLTYCDISGVRFSAGVTDEHDHNAAKLEGAKLEAIVLGADTDLSNVSMRGSSIRRADMRKCLFSQQQVDEMFGDGSVEFPDTLKRPETWPKEALGLKQSFDGLATDLFEEQWRAWQKEIGFDPDDPET